MKFMPLSPGSNMVERWAQLSSARRALLVEAVAGLGIAAAAVRLLPFKRAVRTGSAALARPADPAQAAAFTADVRWAVQAAAKRVPWRSVCFQQGIALQRMLRRRGVDARLHYGVGHVDEARLGAHVWVSVGDQIVIGGEQAASFRLLASFP